MSNLTYTVPDAPGLHTDCPLCGQAMRVQLRGNHLDANCYGGCDPEPALGALGEYDRGRLYVELRKLAPGVAGPARAGVPAALRGERPGAFHAVAGTSTRLVPDTLRSPSALV